MKRTFDLDPVRFLVGIVFSAMLLAAPFPIQAQTILFTDDFDGPALDPVWQASATGWSFMTNAEPCALSFQPLSGASVLRLTHIMQASTAVGWTTKSTFPSRDFRYEVRFNTLVQSPATSIDGFIQIWIVDATDSNRWDFVTLFGGLYGTDPRFAWMSSIDSVPAIPVPDLTWDHSVPFAYRNNTFYRLILQGTAGSIVRGAVLADDGSELFAHAFAHDAMTFTNGFALGFGQCMGLPRNPYPVDVAVDYARLTTQAPLLSIHRTGSEVKLEFSTLSNLTYYVEWTDQLDSGKWFDFGGPVVGNGTIEHLVDVVAGGAIRFYRVKWSVQ